MCVLGCVISASAISRNLRHLFCPSLYTVELHALTFAVCWLRGALGVGGGVVGAGPAAGLAPLRLVEPQRARRALVDVALPVVAGLARH